MYLTDLTLDYLRADLFLGRNVFQFSFQFGLNGGLQRLEFGPDIFIIKLE